MEEGLQDILLLLLLLLLLHEPTPMMTPTLTVTTTTVTTTVTTSTVNKAASTKKPSLTLVWSRTFCGDDCQVSVDVVVVVVAVVVPPLPSLFPFRTSFLLLRLQAHELFWNSSHPGTWTIIVKENESFLKKPHFFQFNFESAETSEHTRTKETDLSCRRLRKLNQLNEAKRFGLDVAAAAAAVVFIPGLEFCCTMFKRREGLQQHDGGRQRGFNFTASLWKKFRNSLDAVDVETAELSTLRLLCLIWLVFNYFLTLAGRLRFNGALLAFSGLATTAIAGGGRERGWKKWGWVRETWVSARPTFLPPSSSPLPLSLSLENVSLLVALTTYFPSPLTLALSQLSWALSRPRTLGHFRTTFVFHDEAHDQCTGGGLKAGAMQSGWNQSPFCHTWCGFIEIYVSSLHCSLFNPLVVAQFFDSILSNYQTFFQPSSHFVIQIHSWNKLMNR